MKTTVQEQKEGLTAEIVWTDLAFGITITLSIGPDRPEQTELTQIRCCRMQHLISLFVLRFYGPVNPMGSCRARSVYLTTRLLGRLSPLSG